MRSLLRSVGSSVVLLAACWPALNAHAIILNGSGQITASGADLGDYLGASSFYNRGYTGGRTTIANVEGGLPWQGHQSLGHVQMMPLVNGAVSSIQDHATGVSEIFGGRGRRALDVGIATGARVFAGTVATAMYGSNFSYTQASVAGTYDEAATGFVSPATGQTVRADVICSSWGILGGYVGISGITNDVDAIVQRTGSLIVVAAGNAGPGPNSVAVPAVALNVMAIGSLSSSTQPQVQCNYTSASQSSSRSPTNILMPDQPLAFTRAAISIAAPGENYSVAAYNGAGTVPNWYNFNCRGTSYAAPTVAGAAALLVDVGYDRFVTPADRSAIDAKTLKAVMMNSADKTLNWDNGQTTSSSGVTVTHQALDYAVGTGRLDIGRAYSQYTDGTTGGITPSDLAPALVASSGWNNATITTAEADHLYEMSDAEPAGSSMAVTLVWFANCSYDAASSTGSFDGLAHLTLEVDKLNPLTGALSMIALSDADYNTAQHLFIILPDTAHYVIKVSDRAADYGPDVPTNYTVAWNVAVVPEPSTAGLALVALPLLAKRRRT